MSNNPNYLYEFGPFRLDAQERLLSRAGESISLTPKAFDLLLVLLEHHGHLLEKEELFKAVWPDAFVEESNLSSNIALIRKTLGGGESGPRYIETVPKRGYRFVAEVRKATPGSDGSVANKDESPAPPANSSAPAGPSTTRAPAPGRRKSVVTLWAVGVSGTVLLAFLAYQLTRRAPERPAPSAVTEIKSLAVLTFKPLVSESRDEFLEMGMADTLIAKLSNSRKIVVRPLGSVRKYGGMQQDPLTAGRELNVESVLEGNIQRRGDHIRVNARLVSVADGASLWVGTFDEKFTDIFAVQDAISEKVAKALSLELSGEEQRHLTKRHTDNSEAYELYLKGRYYWGKVTTPDVNRGIKFFQQAIEIDPDFALAYAGLSDAYRTLPVAHNASPKDAFPEARAAAIKALEMDESLAEAHVSLGFVKFWFDWDWDGAEKDFKRAIDLNPNEAYAHFSYAHLLSNTGRHDEALAEAKRARELDPLSLRITTLEAQFLFYAGRHDEALERTNKVFEIDPNFWAAHNLLGRIYLQKQMRTEALAAFKKAGELTDSVEPVAQLGYVLAKSGQREGVRAALKALRQSSIKEYVPAYNFALIYNGLGERDAALEWLEKSYRAREVQLTFIKIDTRWDEFRSEARFASLTKSMNLE